uniref:Uncharacterized protein n=1 Tax=Siphoviridae sp. ctCCX1 TaxID=2823567 RepID=A0A8S5LDF5_9CAUD|nr:MAG TPA: hypothetical protein [Siphoviridae sp. ctCCX1]
MEYSLYKPIFWHCFCVFILRSALLLERIN